MINVLIYSKNKTIRKKEPEKKILKDFWLTTDVVFKSHLYMVSNGCQNKKTNQLWLE